MSSSLSELMGMDRAALLKQWEERFHGPAPLLVRDGFMRQAIGWQLQAGKEGQLSAREMRQLRNGRRGSPSPLPAGSHLVRVWQGQTHQVTVLDEGFLYAGKNWRSLTAISREITGMAWSGPVFFGIRK